ncbi:MAG: hypothetical protein WC641_03145 [Patescibacteria group bacterium]
MHMEQALRKEEAKTDIANPIKKPRELPADIPSSINPTLYKALWEILPEKNGATPLAKGGEHLVFEFVDPNKKSKHGNVVYKVNFLDSLDIVDAARRGKSKEVDRIVRSMETAMAAREGKLNEMRKYFGFSAVPVQYAAIKQLPVTPQIIEALKPRTKTEGLPKELPVWITVQRKVDLPPEDTHSINGYYPEANFKYKKGVHLAQAEEEYDAAHRTLTGPAQRFSGADRMLCLAIFPELKDVLVLAEADPSFRSKLEEFVHALIRYTQETGTSLDLAGHENVVITKKGEAWQLKMMDALFAREMRLSHLLPVIEKMRTDQAIDRFDFIYAVNILNTIRIANALAGMLGMPDRISMPGLAEIPAEKWRLALGSFLR